MERVSTFSSEMTNINDLVERVNSIRTASCCGIIDEVICSLDFDILNNLARFF